MAEQCVERVLSNTRDSMPQGILSIPRRILIIHKSYAANAPCARKNFIF